MAEIPTYNLEQLGNLNLPGYQQPARLCQIVDPSTDWWPVLSLSIFRKNPENPRQLQILTGVRHNTTTHDGVVSTPTGQISKQHAVELALERHMWFEMTPDQESSNNYLLECLSETAPLTQEFGTLVYYPPNQTRLGSINFLTILSHDVLARKLSFPPSSELRKKHDPITSPLGSVSLNRVIYGFSYVDDEPYTDKPLFEPIVMFGAAVLLNEEGVKLVPSENNKYRNLGWTSNSATFSDDVFKKDVFNLSPTSGDEAVMFCARGLCLATSAAVSIDVLPHLATGKEDDHFYW
jgi:hypothetical protein